MTDRRRALLGRTATIVAALAVVLAGPAGATSPTAAGASSAAPSGSSQGQSGGIPAPTPSPPSTTTTTAPAPTTTAVSAPPVTFPQTTTTATQATTTASTAATTTTTTSSTTTSTKAKQAAAHKPPPQGLSGSLGGGTTFPQRSIVLFDPSRQPLSASVLHLTENGAAVGNFTISPLSSAAAGEFGVVVVLDQSVQMSSNSLASEMAAVHAIAALRTGHQELGVVVYDSFPSILLPLSANAQTIATVIKGTPWVAPGSNSVPAFTLALQQLAAAHIAAGAVILISNSGQSAAGAAQTGALAHAAASVTPASLYTIGLRDASYQAGTIRQLASSVGAKLIQTTPAGLQKAITGLWSQLSGGYLIRYRSTAPRGRAVAVSAHVDGVPGTVSASYDTPAPVVKPKPAAVKPKPTHAPAAPQQAQLPAAAPRAHARQTFWDSPVSVLVVALACGLLIVAAVAIVIRRPSRDQIQSRVKNFIPPPADEEVGLPGGLAVERKRKHLPKLLTTRRWWPEFVSDVGVARIGVAPIALVKRTALTSVLAAVLVTLITGTALIGILCLLPGMFILRAYVRMRARRQRTRFADRLPSHLQDLAGAMRAGRSFVGGISAVADSADEPIRDELERALADEKLGLLLEDTLQAVAERMRSEDMEQVALIASLHRRSGSNVAESLDRVAEGARERADMRREMKALSAQARISGRVLTGLPIVLLFALNFIDPAYAKPLLGTTIGLVVVVFCVILIMIGWMVMNRIVNVDP